jgi:hypothetical protein
MGMTKNYCVVDLPQVNVFQGYLFLKSDLADYVELYGESLSDKQRRIQIIPNTAIGNLDEKSFDIALNVDSMPEMDQDTIREYFGHIERICRDRFISINRELNLTDNTGHTYGWVYDMAKNHPGFKLQSRSPDWMRKGYVEDIFKIQ